MTGSSPSDVVSNSGADPTPSESRHSILVVDDESSTVAIVKNYLREGGYKNVLTVIDSRQALPMLFSWKPDLVILDLCMPDVSGLDILTAMRHDKTLSPIAVVAITATTDEELIERVHYLGVSSLIRKPLNASKVIEAAHSALLPVTSAR